MFDRYENPFLDSAKMKSSRTPKSIQRAQRDETRKERHAVAQQLRQRHEAIHLMAFLSLSNERMKVRHERE